MVGERRPRVAGFGIRECAGGDHLLLAHHLALGEVDELELEVGEGPEDGRNGLSLRRIGEGAAISLYLFPVLMFVVWAQLRFVRKQAY